jgi:hypothetical protein
LHASIDVPHSEHNGTAGVNKNLVPEARVARIIDRGVVQNPIDKACGIASLFAGVVYPATEVGRQPDGDI